MKFLAACLLFLLLPTSALAADAVQSFVSTRPAARVEYWQHRQQAIATELENKDRLRQVRLLFVGDSITDFWLLDQNPWVDGQWFGRKIWDESFATPGSANYALNIGISGDRIEHVLYRLQPRRDGGLGELDAPELAPEYIVLMLGINNSWAAEQPVVDSISAGVHAVLESLRARKPGSRIILQSLLPTQDPRKNADVVRPVNDRLRAMTESAEFKGQVVWLELYGAFIDDHGVQIGGHFDDGLHPNAKGYRLWRDRLVPFIEQLRKQGPSTSP